jgi:hypothetical protein
MVDSLRRGLFRGIKRSSRKTRYPQLSTKSPALAIRYQSPTRRAGIGESQDSGGVRYSFTAYDF